MVRGSRDVSHHSVSHRSVHSRRTAMSMMHSDGKGTQDGAEGEGDEDEGEASDLEQDLGEQTMEEEVNALAEHLAHRQTEGHQHLWY